MGRIPEKMSDSVSKMSLGYIRPHHREIARRLVLGQRQSQICKELGMSPDRMSIIVNSPLFKIELKRLERERDSGVADVTKTLQELAPVALESVERTMYSAKSERLRFEAAESILDRAGFGKIGKSEVRVSHTSYSSMTEDELKRLVAERVRRIKEMAEEKRKQEEEASAITVEFEKVSQEDAVDTCNALQALPQ